MLLRILPKFFLTVRLFGFLYLENFNISVCELDKNLNKNFNQKGSVGVSFYYEKNMVPRSSYIKE